MKTKQAQNKVRLLQQTIHKALKHLIFLQAVAGGYQVRPLSLLLSLLDLAKSRLLLLRPTEKAKELRAVGSR